MIITKQMQNLNKKRREARNVYKRTGDTIDLQKWKKIDNQLTSMIDKQIQYSYNLLHNNK